MLAILLTVFSFVATADDSVRVDASKKLVATSADNISDTLKIGRFLTVNRIFITGNRITRDNIILRELSLKKGEVVYSADLEVLLDLDRKKLLNTRLFNTVEIRTVELEPMTLDLIVDVSERWYTFPAPIFELADRNFNDWWQNYNHDLERVNYGLRLYQYNMRGRNETLRLHAQFGFQRRFEILYRFPYIDKKQKHGLTFDFTYAETKNAVFQTKDHKYEFLQGENILRTNRFGGVTYTYRNSFYQTHSVKAEYYNTFFDDTLQYLNPIYFPYNKSEQTYTSLMYGFTSDHRDYVSYPLKGHVLMTEARAVGLLTSDDVEKLELTVNYSKYLTLNNNFFLSNNIVGYLSTPSDLPYINFGVLGLRRQFVRGYEIYVIEGPQYAINKTTFKKLLFSRTYHWLDMPIEQFRHIPLAIYLKTYADVGYVKNYSPYESLELNTRLSDKLITGAGFGFDVVGSYDVVLRFEYTFNAEGERGFFFHLRREF